MPNLYDTFTPAEWEPLPYSDLLQAGLHKQKRRDETLSFLKPQGLSSIEEHDSYRNSYMNAYRQKSEELLKSGVDLGSKEGRDKAQRLAYTFANDPNIQKLKRSEENKKEFLESKRKAQEKGTYSDYLNPIADKEAQYELYKQGKADNPWIDKNGDVIEFPKVAVGEVQDRVKPATELFDKMKANGNLSDITTIDPNTGNLIGKVKGWEGIASKRIKDQATENIPLFLQTLGGRDFIKELQYHKPNITKDELILATKDHLDRIADNYVYNKYTNKDDISFGPEDIRKALKTTEVPYYESPLSSIKGVDYEGAFDVQDKGKFIGNKMTEEEMKKQGPSKFSSPSNSSFTTEKAYIQPSQMNEKQKAFLSNVSKWIDPKLKEKIDRGEDLTKEEQEKLYPQVKVMAEKAKKDVETNSGVIVLNERDAKEENLELFGKEDPTGKDLGTGSAINTKVFDKADGKTISYEQFLKKVPEDSRVSVRTKFTYQNPYSLITGDKDFSIPTQVSVDGKEYIFSSPKVYVDSKTQSTDNNKNIQFQHEKAANAIYTSKFTTLPQEFQIHGVDIETYYDEKNNKYNVKIGDKYTSFKTPKEAADAILLYSKDKEDKKEK